jgi:hypothetical protein
MASVVFLRGVNVGGHRTFQPSVFARELADYNVVKVGVAGTFVVRKAVGQATPRAEILRRLPFEAGLMFCKGSDLTALASAGPFPQEASPEDARPFVSALEERPRALPPLPLSQLASGPGHK